MYSKGKKGESIAERHVLNQGYMVHFRNKRVGRNEVDLVCEERGTIVFIEVKSLSYDSIKKPYQSVDRVKQQKILKVADQLAVEHFPNHDYRFDIISIVFSNRGHKLEHIKNAFTSEIDKP